MPLAHHVSAVAQGPQLLGQSSQVQPQSCRLERLQRILKTLQYVLFVFNTPVRDPEGTYHDYWMLWRYDFEHNRLEIYDPMK